MSFSILAPYAQTSATLYRKTETVNSIGGKDVSEVAAETFACRVVYESGSEPSQYGGPNGVRNVTLLANLSTTPRQDDEVEIDSVRYGIISFALRNDLGVRFYRLECTVKQRGVD